jgi:hypothetical protein
LAEGDEDFLQGGFLAGRVVAPLSVEENHNHQGYAHDEPGNEAAEEQGTDGYPADDPVKDHGNAWRDDGSDG